MVVKRSSGRRAFFPLCALIAGSTLCIACADDSADDAPATMPSTSAEPSASTTTTDDTTTDDTTTDDTTTDDTTTDDGGDAFAFTDPDGRYSATFPFEPITRASTTALQDGTELEVVFYMAEGDTFAMATSCIDYAEYGSDIGVDLVGARDGAITNTGGNLLTSEEIVVQGRSAIEFTAAFKAGSQSGFMIGRVFADGTASCQAFALDVADTLSDASFEFVESFQFVEEL